MSDELIDIIDEDGNDIGLSKLKSEVHKSGEWHKSSHIWIVKNGKILLQKRASSKEFFPDCFDVACAGHVKSGETYEDAALRELDEELNVKVSKNDLTLLEKRKQISEMKQKNIVSREIMRVFLLKLKCELEYNRDDISELRFFYPKELKMLLKEKPEMFVDDRPYFFEIVDIIEKQLNSP